MPDLVADDRELLALLSLLETESESTVSIMLEQMRSFSDATLERLAHLVDVNAPVQRYVNLVLAEHQAPLMQAALLDWRGSGMDLEEGMLLVARTGYPTVDIESIGRQLDDLAARIREGMPHENPEEMLAHMTRVLIEDEGFIGNTADYYEPDNTYINRVLDRRTGLPIAMAALYVMLGRRLGMSFAGIALPAHFIAAFLPAGRTIYFDPFNGGTILSMNEVVQIVQRAGQTFNPSHLLPASPLLILQRMFANLQKAYEIREELERVALVRQYRSVLN